MAFPVPDREQLAYIRAYLDRPIVLTGLMGSGKTRLGRLLADALDLPFADSDEEIEKAAGLLIPDIFEKFGEPYFREGEHRVVCRLLDEGVGVIALGGGAIMTPATAQRIWSESITLWVKASLPVMLARTAKSDRRPLLKTGDPETILTDLMAKRRHVYEKSDIVVVSGEEAAEGMLVDALDSLERFLRTGEKQA